MRVLLIDDSKTARTSQKHVLIELGHTTVDEAADGEEGFACIGANPPDLILLDWNMPGMTGLEFLQKFRETDQETPVIMVTTESERHRVLDAVKSGVNNYVIKPYRKEQLRDLIVETINAMEKERKKKAAIAKDLDQRQAA